MCGIDFFACFTAGHAPSAIMTLSQLHDSHVKTGVKQGKFLWQLLIRSDLSFARLMDYKVHPSLCSVGLIFLIAGKVLN